jgi:putative hemolysin
MNSLELLSCVVLVCLSAYLSSSEIAIFSLSRFQLRFLKENFRPVHRNLRRLLGDPGGALLTILIVTEILNITVSSIITHALSHNPTIDSLKPPFAPEWVFETLLGIVIATPIILIFCEATPKVIGAKMNQLIATMTVGPLSLIYTVLQPVRMLIKLLLRLVPQSKDNLMSLDKNEKIRKKQQILKESDFLLMVEEGHREGAIRETELELIRNVFELDHTTVQDVATPMSQVLTLSAQTTLKEALNTVREQNYSRIPIIRSGNHKKDIIGILYSKDLLRSKLSPESGAITVATLMKKPYFVLPELKLNNLFRKFKQNKIHMAIVKNKKNEITGIITMSDILDALFEELFEDAI